MKKRVFQGVVGVVLALLVYWMLFRDGSAVDGQVALPKSDPTATAVRRKAADSRCVRVLAELKRQADALEPLDGLRTRVKLAKGQAERVVGTLEPIPVPETGPASADVFSEAARATVGEGIEVLEVDCDEYPCIVRYAGPPAANITNSQFASAYLALQEETGLHVLSREVERGEGRTLGAVAFFDRPQGHDEQELRSRVAFRNARARAERAGEPVVALGLEPPELPESPEPDPCGPAHDRVRQELHLHEVEKLAGEATLAYLEAVVQLIEGPPKPFPEDLPARYRLEALGPVADEMADRLGLEVLDVDCSEYPCLLMLSGRIAFGTDIIDVVVRAPEAAPGYASEELSPLPIIQHGKVPFLDLVVVVHPPGAELDEKRIEARRPWLEPQDAPVSSLDWSVPLAVE